MTEPYYADDFVTLYLGKYQDHMDILTAAKPDAIVTDPPYGETSLEWDVWPTGWLADAALISRVLWCWGSFRMFHEHAAEFAPWKLAQDSVWEKQNGSGFHADRLKRVHELATHWYQGEWGTLYNEPPKTMDATAKVTRRKGRPAHTGMIDNPPFVSEDGGPRLQRSVVKLRNMHGRAINETEKPVQMQGLYVEHSVPPGGLLVDLFAGSGSAGMAARQQGKRAILVERRESQCEATAKRLERETGMTLEGIA